MLKRRIEVLILAIVGLAILGLAGGFPEAFAISSKNLALTASVKDALSLALSGNSLDLDLTPTPSGVFRTDNFSATVSTTNQTGYTLYVAATGLDHNDTVTANLVHSSPDVLSVIEPLGSVVVVSRSGDTYTDTSSFGNDKWGLSTDATTFKPVSTTNNIFDSYEENTSDRVTNFTFGTKVDTNIVAGTYSNTLTVTAIANPVYRTFTINYDLDGGEGETIQTESIADEYYPEVTITSTVPTKAYHTFLGYATSEADAEEGIVTYQPGDKISMDYEDPTVELYAVWKAYTYTLVYNANNGTGAPNSQTMTYGENTTISATTPTRTGYTFLGWSLSSTVTSATYTANTTYATTTITDAAGITSHNEESATLYAVWELSKYDVNIVLAGTGLSRSTSSVSVVYGSNNTVTITPGTDYYISAASCTNGYSVSVFTGNGAAISRTATITNNSVESTGTCTFTGALDSCTTKYGSGVAFRLKDGYCWTRNSRGEVAFASVSTVSCPSGMAKPTGAKFAQFIEAYGGVASTTTYGSPYGHVARNDSLYNVFGKAMHIWSSDEALPYNGRTHTGWQLFILKTSSRVTREGGGGNVWSVLCYGS